MVLVGTLNWSASFTLRDTVEVVQFSLYPVEIGLHRVIEHVLKNLFMSHCRSSPVIEKFRSSIGGSYNVVTELKGPYGQYVLSVIKKMNGNDVLINLIVYLILRGLKRNYRRY